MSKAQKTKPKSVSNAESKGKRRAKKKRVTRRSKFTLEALSGRLSAPIEDLSGDITRLRKRVLDSIQDNLSETTERVQNTKLAEQLRELEGKAENEIDELLSKLGLMRVKTHETLVTKAKKSAIRAERRRVKKAQQARSE